VLERRALGGRFGCLGKQGKHGMCAHVWVAPGGFWGDNMFSCLVLARSLCMAGASQAHARVAAAQCPGIGI